MEEINVLVIAGAGFMGQGIARAALKAGFSALVLHDNNPPALDRAYADLSRQWEILQSGPGAAELTRGIVKQPRLDLALQDADFVIEAIPEIKSLKQELFRTLATHAPAHCVFATNTSTMSIDDIATFSHAQDRVIGMHFFVPEESRLIEITRGAHTSDATVRKALSVGNRLPCKNGTRKAVVLDRWRPGFIVNRSIAPVVAYLNWVIDDAQEKGVTAQQLDAEIEKLMPGFYKTMDFVGLDVVNHTCISFAETLSPDLGPGRVLSDLVRNEHLGIKTGRGFYRYRSDGQPIDESSPSQGSGLIDVELILALQFNECCRIVEEGLLSDLAAIDDCVHAALNVPGPCLLGLEHRERWCALLHKLSLESGKAYFQPSRLMLSGALEEPT